MKSLPEADTAQESLQRKWDNLPYWLRFNRPLAWVIVITIVLTAVLIWMPPYMRDYLWRSIQTHRVLSGMILGFSLVALSLLWSLGQRVDTWIFLMINMHGPRPLGLDRLMWGFTQLGNSLTTLLLAFIMFLAGDRLLAYELALGTLTLWLVVEAIKATIRRRRPFLLLTQTRVIGPREAGRSFPSGHTSQAFFVATLLITYFEVTGWLLVPIYIVAGLVGFTRMYVGVHYPRDVMAGMILGSAWGLLAGIIFRFTPFSL